MNEAPEILQISIDRGLKEAAEEIFAEIGLDSTTAVRLFFTQVAQTRSIPFVLRANPEFSPEAEARILEASKEAENPDNLYGPFTSADEAIENLHRLAAEFTEVPA
ncbi:type II toxin-antitoxin system RelB/DinJ family antitoxin [bacterium]|nr:type II toxin-antitoxin system RelB/DinJ family antitoxin [bacterium]